MNKELALRHQAMGLETACALARQPVPADMMHAIVQEGVQTFVEKRQLAWK
jgi:hypothetical protein